MQKEMHEVTAKNFDAVINAQTLATMQDEDNEVKQLLQLFSWVKTRDSELCMLRERNFLESNGANGKLIITELGRAALTDPRWRQELRFV
jgi:hypothetical protein